MLDSRRQREAIASISIDVVVVVSLVSFLAYLSFSYVAPFFTILLWASILAVALHPGFVKLSERMGGKGGRAATVIALLGVALLLTPTIMIVDALLDSIFEWNERLKNNQVQVPAPPESVKDWPLIGGRLHDIWSAASANLASTAQQYSAQIQDFGGRLLSAGAGLFGGVLAFMLSIIFAGVFLAYGDSMVAGTRRIARRIGSERGEALVSMAGATVRNVARGVLGVAFIQGSLASLGIIAAGLPFAGFLAGFVVLMCIVQAPPLGILPIIGLAWGVQDTTTAAIFTVYMLVVMFLDNVLKPILLARGLSTPMIVILIGVIGGTLTSGLLGLFIGPVILAVFYELVVAWLATGEEGGEKAPEKDAGVTADGG